MNSYFLCIPGDCKAALFIRITAFVIDIYIRNRFLQVIDIHHIFVDIDFDHPVVAGNIKFTVFVQAAVGITCGH